MRRNHAKVSRSGTETTLPEEAFDLLPLHRDALNDPQRVMLFEKCQAAVLLRPVGSTADLDQTPQGEWEPDPARWKHGIDLRPPASAFETAL